MRPRSREVPVSSRYWCRETDKAAEAPVGTRDPQRSFADETTAKNERAGPPTKIQDPLS